MSIIAGACDGEIQGEGFGQRAGHLSGLSGRISQISMRVGELGMKHLLHTILVALFSVAMLSGCMPTKPDSSSPSARLQYSIDHGDYKYAYVALQELRSNKDAKSQNDYKRFMDTYRAQLEQGGLDYLRNYAESTALLYGSLDEFILSAQDKLNAYNAVASVCSRVHDIFDYGFREDRQQRDNTDRS